MRRIPTVSVLSALAALLAFSACRNDDRPGPEGMTADLERDLQLASSARPSRDQAVSAIELTANGGLSGDRRGERALVRTPRRAPTPSPTASLQEVAAPNTPDQQRAPIVAPTVTESAPAPAPAPVLEPAMPTDHGPYLGTASSGPSAGSTDEGDRGRGDRGRMPGVIIRGGAPGEDHCEPRGGRRHPGMGGIGGIFGGMGGGRRMPNPRY